MTRPDTASPALPTADDASGKDERSDLEQAVDARKDAVERGEGGDEVDAFTAPGDFDGVGGTGGVVKNQDQDAQ